MAGSDFSAKFVRPDEPQPLAERDVIAIGPDHDKGAHHVDNMYAERAISFRSILETGEVPSAGGIYAGNNQSIDWSSDDAYTRAIEQITKASQQRIAEDPATRALLEKPEWTREDRVEWERHTSEIVSDEMAKIPGLADYRIEPATSMVNEQKKDPLAEFATAKERITGVNGLAADIEANAGNIEFDCETMSITEGVVLQQIEDNMLPQAAAVEGSMKQSSAYYYATGMVTFLDDENPAPGGHAFIVSSATGNIVESTARPDNMQFAYQEMQPGYSFEDFIGGRMGMNPDTLYMTTITPEVSAQAQVDAKAIPFDTYLDAVGRRSDALITHMGEVGDAPEVDALQEFKNIQAVRPLMPMELDAAKGVVQFVQESADFQRADSSYAAYKEDLYELYESAKDDPEKLKAFESFLGEERAKFAAADAGVPYAVDIGEDNSIHSYGIAQAALGEIDAYQDDMPSQQAPQMERQGMEQNTSAHRLPTFGG